MSRLAWAVPWLLVLTVLGPGPGAAEPRPGLPEDLRRFRDAHEALVRGEYARARVGFEGIPPDSVLADYAAFFAAEALVRAGDEAGALERWRELPERFPTSRLAAEALLAAADTAFRLGRWAEAERTARRFLARAPGHREAGRVLVRLAEARAAQGHVAEAIADLRRRWLEAPASGWGQAAREVAEDLAARHGLILRPPSVEERLLLAERLAEAGELSAAAGVLEALLAEVADPPGRHQVLLRLAPLWGRLGRVGEAVARLEGALEDRATPARAPLLLALARLYRRAGAPAGAVGALERLVGEGGEPGTLSEAWLLLARLRAELGDEAGARAALQTVVTDFPDTGAAPPAAWGLAWLAYRAGQYREAALAFRRLAAGSLAYRVAGLYWAARALERAGVREAAAALYREVLRHGPHGYYGLLAARRVTGSRPPPAAAPVVLPRDPHGLLAREPGYLKGRALWRVGLQPYALAEFEGISRDGGLTPAHAYALGVVLAELGETSRSLRYLRASLGPAAEAGALGLRGEFWRLLFPLGYGDLVREAARRAGLDPFLVAAVIREESSFDPHARSPAGALGLMQLMPETARQVAAGAGLGVAGADGLRDAAVNIALGTRYLAELLQRFADPLLAVAGYNAGPHRVARWLEEFPGLEPDEFVERIPFEETRAFVKRVATSWHHYARLYRSEAPGQRRATGARR